MKERNENDRAKLNLTFFSRILSSYTIKFHAILLNNNAITESLRSAISDLFCQSHQSGRTHILSRRIIVA